jgi:hypothetical protein
LVVDLSDRNVKLYDSLGVRLGMIGQQGRGPHQLRAVLSAFAVEGGVGLYDFAASEFIVLSENGEELHRVSLVRSRMDSQPVSLRLLAPELLLAVHQSGHGRADLLQLIGLEGKSQLNFMPLAEWYDENEGLVGGERVLADGHDGCIFAATARSDSLRVFDYAGNALAAGVWDPELRWGPVEDPNSSSSTSSGDVPFVAGVVALPGCEALVQVGEMVQGVRVNGDPLEGGQIALFRAFPDGQLQRLATTRVTDGGLLGRDRSGHGLVVRRPPSVDGDYALLRVDRGR